MGRRSRIPFSNCRRFSYARWSGGLCEREEAKSFLLKIVVRQSRHIRMSSVSSGGEDGDFSFVVVGVTLRPTSEEQFVRGSAQTTRPQRRQWCRLKDQDPNSWWQKGHLRTLASSSQVTTDCSNTFRWFFCPARLNIPPLLAITSSGGFANSCVSFVSRFSNLETSRYCLSTVFLLIARKSFVWSRTNPWSL